MPDKAIDPDNIGQDEDWVGNSAAFTCPLCGSGRRRRSVGTTG